MDNTTTHEHGVGLAGQAVNQTEIDKAEFETRCKLMREQLGKDAQIVKYFKEHMVFASGETYKGQHGEMKANIMLAYRHLEDARMRIGKVLQAAGDGVSILDK